MARTLRAPKSANEVDRKHIHLSFHFADDAAEEPGAAMVSVYLQEEARKTKGRDAEGNDHYRNLSLKLSPQILNMKLGEALDHLAILQLAADEDKAVELAAAQPGG